MCIIFTGLPRNQIVKCFAGKAAVRDRAARAGTQTISQHINIICDRSAGLGRMRLFHPWAHEPESGVVGRLRVVSHVVGPSQGSGLMGWVGSRQGTSGSRMVPYRSTHLSYTDTGQSSDPSGLVGSRRVISGSDGFPSEPCFGMTGPDGARRIARLSRIGARLM